MGVLLKKHWVFVLLYLCSCTSDLAHGVVSIVLGMQVQDGKQAQYDAFYRLSNTEQQITSYVFDVSNAWYLSIYGNFHQ